ncbi:hypothetical protein GCM10009638_02920 [Luteococcus sanguinis]
MTRRTTLTAALTGAGLLAASASLQPAQAVTVNQHVSWVCDVYGTADWNLRDGQPMHACNLEVGGIYVNSYSDGRLTQHIKVNWGQDYSQGPTVSVSAVKCVIWWSSALAIVLTTKGTGAKVLVATSTLSGFKRC